MVWKECKIAVGMGIAISKLDFVPVGFEALDITVACLVCWNYSEKNVISHESVDWFSVTVVAVDPPPKRRSGEVRMQLLQLQQDVSSVSKKYIYNPVGMWCSS